MPIPKEITDDLRAGLTLEETLTKHSTNLREIFKDFHDYPQYRRPRKPKKKTITKREEWRYIQPTRFNSYSVRKTSNGKQSYYGCYKTFEDAKKVREALIADGWNKEHLPQILKDLKIKTRRPGGWQK